MSLTLRLIFQREAFVHALLNRRHVHTRRVWPALRYFGRNRALRRRVLGRIVNTMKGPRWTAAQFIEAYVLRFMRTFGIQIIANRR